MARFSPPTSWSPRFFEGRPVFAPVAAAARAFEGERGWPAVSSWNHGSPLENAAGLPVSFVTQPPKPSRRGRKGRPVDLGEVYDERIYARGEVPSREASWHDFFNMLVWRSFPRAKAQINARQRAALVGWAAPGDRALPGARTREQDALAMLDEGGLLLLCAAGPAREAEVSALLADGSTGGLARLGDLARAGEIAPMVLGHALYEHLVLSPGWPELRACGVVLSAPGPLPPSPDERRALADQALSATLARAPFAGGAGVLLDRRLFEPGEPGVITSSGAPGAGPR